MRRKINYAKKKRRNKRYTSKRNNQKERTTMIILLLLLYLFGVTAFKNNFEISKSKSQYISPLSICLIK